MISLGGLKNARKRNNTFISPYEFRFDAEETGASWQRNARGAIVGAMLVPIHPDTG
jgi:hypothetical protein